MLVFLRWRDAIPASGVMQACASRPISSLWQPERAAFRQHSANRLSAAGVRRSCNGSRPCTESAAQSPRAVIQPPAQGGDTGSNLVGSLTRSPTTVTKDQGTKGRRRRTADQVRPAFVECHRIPEGHRPIQIADS